MTPNGPAVFSDASAVANLSARLPMAAQVWGTRLAVVHRGGDLTFGELDRLSGQAAQALLNAGIRPGDRVALQMPNIPAFVGFYYGALRIGAIIVPMNPLLKEREVAHFLDDSGARLLVVLHEFASVASGPARAAGIRVLEVRDPMGADLLDRLDPTGMVAPVAPDATAVIFYTSGTTGVPKGAELTHQNVSRNAASTVALFALEASDVLIGVLPLYHSFAQTCVLNAAFAVGATVALQTRFEGKEALELIAGSQATIFMGVPTMYSELMEAAAGPEPFRSLRLCVSGGAAMPLEMMRRFEHLTGLPVYEGYGLSETSPVATFNRATSTPKIGSIGGPIEGVEMRVIDSEGVEVDLGEIGEIVIRGHNVMKGYWRNPVATRAAIDTDGWFHSGDLGREDVDGDFFLVGRLKDVIIRGGINVYPRELEEILHEHPQVLEAAVVGIPDSRLGEEVAAAVVRRPGATVSTTELQAWIKNQVAAYKYPRRIWFVDGLPKGPTGKILKRAINAPNTGAAE